MRICNILNQKKPTISFEIFPPKRIFDYNTIKDTIEDLTHLKPDFISVTYGAGGSTKGKTLEIASLLKNVYNTETLAHLTCVSATKEEIEEIADELTNNQIENVLALRGDFPSDPNFEFPNPLHYEHATDLLFHLNQNYKFCLGGAFYPEGHIEAKSLQEDKLYQTEKAKVGAEFLISQLFFDNELFFEFESSFQDMGQKIPLIAGIFPITNAKQILRMSSLSGSTIPRNLSRLVAQNSQNPVKLKQMGIQYAIDQIQDLIDRGVRGIHLYTMNKPAIAKEIMNNITL
jgi:methylenetetrahydrofolate reductase (NADPH)